MPELHVGGLSADPPELDDLINQVANIEGDLRLESSGEIIYAEEHFPVVELARQLSEWSATATDPDSDFEFDSMFFEERGMIWVRRTGDGWRVGSIEQARPVLDELSWTDLRSTVQRFIDEVIAAGKRNFQVDLSPTIASDRPSTGRETST